MSGWKSKKSENQFQSRPIVKKFWNSVNVRMEEYTAAAAPPKEFMNLWIYLHNQKTFFLKSSKKIISFKFQQVADIKCKL